MCGRYWWEAFVSHVFNNQTTSRIITVWSSPTSPKQFSHLLHLRLINTLCLVVAIVSGRHKNERQPGAVLVSETNGSPLSSEGWVLISPLTAAAVERRRRWLARRCPPPPPPALTLIDCSWSGVALPPFLHIITSLRRRSFPSAKFPFHHMMAYYAPDVHQVQRQLGRLVSRLTLRRYGRGSPHGHRAQLILDNCQTFWLDRVGPAHSC